MIDLIMDLNKKIILHQGDKSVELPLINLLRLTMTHLKEFVKEYQAKDPNIQKFWDWVLKEKLQVGVGEGILQ